MLIRISLILAIAAGLAVGGLNIARIRGKITTLVAQRDDYHTQLTQTQATLETTKKDLATTQDTLKQTQQDLADTKSERDKAVARADAQTKLAAEAATKLAQTTQERDTAQNELAAYKAPGLTAEQVGKLSKTLKDTQAAVDAANQENAVLGRTIARLQTRLNLYEEPSTKITMRADLKGRILVVDPKWDFVVLNVGDAEGVRENGELLVSRDGKLVAKVVVRSVQKDRSIANIVPGWKLGDVFEGDEVIPAYPAS